LITIVNILLPGHLGGSGGGGSGGGGGGYLNKKMSELFRFHIS
jgi:hypothetical protein